MIQKKLLWIFFSCTIFNALLLAKDTPKPNPNQSIWQRIGSFFKPAEKASTPCEKIDRLSYAKQILNEDHYGFEKPKERVLDFIATQNLSKNARAPILCLVGPSGIGKTSFSKSVARSFKGKYDSISLNNMLNLTIA